MSKKPCKIWTKGTVGKGYGYRWKNGRKRLVHRIEWEEHYGPIPKGMLVCHTCDNPPCWEITHLFLGTTKDNADDMVAKGRNKNQNKGKTHCKHGHEFNEANTYLTKRGRRHCKTCNRDRQRQYADLGQTKIGGK